MKLGDKIIIIQEVQINRIDDGEIFGKIIAAKIRNPKTGEEREVKPYTISSAPDQTVIYKNDPDTGAEKVWRT